MVLSTKINSGKQIPKFDHIQYSALKGRDTTSQGVAKKWSPPLAEIKQNSRPEGGVISIINLEYK